MKIQLGCLRGLRVGVMIWGLGSAVGVITQDAWAVGSSGFENASLSTRSLARGNASVADDSDPSAVAFNPAALTRLEEREVYTGTTLILTSIDYDGLGGLVDEEASQTVIPVPYLYANLPLGDRWALGVGANSPFGLITDYSSTGSFKYIAHYNEIKTNAYHLSLAYEVTPEVSVGGGWTLMRLDLKQVGKFNSLFLAGDVRDADFEYEVGGEGQGWNAGLFWEITPKDRLGLFYRSEVRTHLKGTMSTHELTGTMAAIFGGASDITSADTDITLPSNATVGYCRKVTDRLEIEFDAGWTGWSANDSLKTVFGDSNAILAGFENIHRDYNDAWSFHLGTTFEVDEVTTLNWGYFFYQRAADRHNYTNENPDANKHGFSVGWEKNWKSWTFDVMYEAIFNQEESIRNTAGVTNGTDVDGEYSGWLQLLSTGVRYRY